MPIDAEYYKDLTFCTATDCRKYQMRFSTCHRALTDIVRDQAAEWWGADHPPIATYVDPQNLPCFEEKQPKQPSID